MLTADCDLVFPGGGDASPGSCGGFAPLLGGYSLSRGFAADGRMQSSAPSWGSRPVRRAARCTVAAGARVYSTYLTLGVLRRGLSPTRASNTSSQNGLQFKKSL